MVRRPPSARLGSLRILAAAIRRSRSPRPRRPGGGTGDAAAAPVTPGPAPLPMTGGAELTMD